jgi:threonyl-tRNA synthetase
VQLDFNLPERFNLTYNGPEQSSEANPTRPVMIHRALVGSIERFIGVLTEHCAGNWPFWLSPRQVVVIPVAPVYVSHQSLEGLSGLFDRGWWGVSTQLRNLYCLLLFFLLLFSLHLLGSTLQKDYANEVAAKLWDKGLFAEADVSPETLKKKILNAEVARWNFILVVGEDEMTNRSVNVRSRDEEQKGRSETLSLEDAVEKLVKLKETKGAVSKLE